MSKWIMWTIGCYGKKPEVKETFHMYDHKNDADEMVKDLNKLSVIDGRHYFVFPVKIEAGICELSGEGCAVTDGCELCTFCERTK